MKLTTKEKEALASFTNEFEFEKLEEINNSPFVVISAKQGMGKTHLACTMSTVMPTYVIDT